MSALDEFVDGYVEAMVWVGLDWRLTDPDLPDDEREANPIPLDEAGFSTEDVAPEALAAMAAECEDFWTHNFADLAIAYGMREGTRSQRGEVFGWDWLGHDFALTRNGHGAGFWDRGLGVVGDRLTDAAHSYGSSDLYVGDNDLLYVE